MRRLSGQLGLAINAVVRRVMPDPFVLAIGLTFLTGALVWWFCRTGGEDGMLRRYGPGEILEMWRGGLWDLLAFSMQMCLILVTGHALASSPPIRRGLARLANLPRSMTQAAVLVAAVAMGLGLLNWGLGLIAGALLARDVGRGLARRGIDHHYPLLVAAGYLGLLVWHGGFSGSAPLKVSTEKDLAEVFAGLDLGLEPIAIDRTIVSLENLLISGGAVIVALLTIALIVPHDRASMEPMTDFTADDPDDERPRKADRPRSLPEWLERSTLVALLLALPALWALGTALAGGAWKSLTPNEVNLAFLGLGLVMHGTPRGYLEAVGEAVGGCSGIILQFPLYAGIMGLMKASGLTVLMAERMAEGANATTLPLATFASAAVVNVFVPSGGGQWAVQGPVAMEAAARLGVDPARQVMAVAYGDQLTNMLQPFWALPLLAITGARARDIVGFTAIVMCTTGAWFAVGLLLT